jgi:hypothetical protein
MVTEYEPVRAFTAISRFGPFTFRQSASFEPVTGGSAQLRSPSRSCCGCYATPASRRPGETGPDRLHTSDAGDDIACGYSLVTGTNGDHLG